MKKVIAVIGIIIICSLICGTCQAQTWQPNKSVIKAKKDSVKPDNTKRFQCWGTTQKGERCKRNVLSNGDFCYQHQTQKTAGK